MAGKFGSLTHHKFATADIDLVASIDINTMTKNSKKRKLAQAAAATLELPRTPPNDNGDPLEEQFDSDELGLCTEVLTSLASLPTSAIKGKRLKPLRTALYSLHASLVKSGFPNTVQLKNNGNLSTRVSEALADSRWVDARVLLAEIRIRGDEIKLGTLQRWVRDCDAASVRDAEVGDEVFKTLAYVLRACSSESSIHDNRNPGDGSNAVNYAKPIQFAQKSAKRFYHAAKSQSLVPTEEQTTRRREFRIISITPGAVRKPPNAYPATIYLSSNNAIELTEPEELQTARHNITGLQGAFVISDLLSENESSQIIRNCESLGFNPDLPIAGNAAQQVSILANNVYWFCNEQLLSTIYQRAVPFLPSTYATQTKDGSGKVKVKGLNARFRVYRYEEGGVYRPHIDGAWPESAISPDTTEEAIFEQAENLGSQSVKDAYVYDKDGTSMSKLTFLIYLNDDFENGWTTFFLPSNSNRGLEMDAIRIEPRMGAALVFPHGECLDALLHEGSGVKSGYKYVIRTDVLYEKAGVVL